MLVLVLALMFPSLAKLILERALAFAGVCMNSCACSWACAYVSVTSEIDP